MDFRVVSRQNLKRLNVKLEVPLNVNVIHLPICLFIFLPGRNVISFVEENSVYSSKGCIWKPNLEKIALSKLKTPAIPRRSVFCLGDESPRRAAVMLTRPAGKRLVIRSSSGPTRAHVQMHHFCSLLNE